MSEEDMIEKNVSLVLRYHQPPQLNLMVEEGEEDHRRGGAEGERQLRILNEAYNLSCVAEGFPLDTATSEWTFKACREVFISTISHLNLRFSFSICLNN